ncbi:hypothetical protein [Actinomadura sp. NTSP31]|uniref:hypothetical protein n=1 Tax=Actinomadura sp. NTSP31 TaxID=1735447 RepID=UPI0035C052A1
MWLLSDRPTGYRPATGTPLRFGELDDVASSDVLTDLTTLTEAAAQSLVSAKCSIGEDEMPWASLPQLIVLLLQQSRPRDGCCWRVDCSL